jgi:hypothetical protein
VPPAEDDAKVFGGQGEEHLRFCLVRGGLRDGNWGGYLTFMLHLSIDGSPMSAWFICEWSILKIWEFQLKWYRNCS